MTLWLVRHAPTLAPPGLCYGRLDVAPDPQATAASAQALAAALPPQVLLRTSPSRRCRALADAVVQLRPELALHVDPRLQEMDFGRWEGQPWDAIGEAAVTQWTNDFAQHRPGGGESVQALLARVGAAFDEARAASADCVWITHAGVVRAARLLARGVRAIERAADWPQQAVGFGCWETLALDRPG